MPASQSTPRRVFSGVQSLRSKFVAFRVQDEQAACPRAAELLIKNFYRHPGTALFNTMVSGHDSYCRHVYQKRGAPANGGGLGAEPAGALQGRLQNGRRELRRKVH